MPLLFMYPEADVPVLQISMPSEEPRVLLEIGRRLAPLRDEGVLIMGSGFMTHSFEAFRERATPRADATTAIEGFWYGNSKRSVELR
jgi:4,5-DOPA dioxygenase extradiol